MYCFTQSQDYLKITWPDVCQTFRQWAYDMVDMVRELSVAKNVYLKSLPVCPEESLRLSRVTETFSGLWLYKFISCNIKFILEIRFAFAIIARLLNIIGIWNPSSSKTMTYLVCVVNTMTAYDLTTQGPNASAAMEGLT